MNVNFLLSGSVVRRFHTVDTIKEDLVGRHSHGVAMLCFAMSEKPSLDLIMAALSHDLGEQVIGDIPSPTKRALGSGMERIDAMEENALLDQGLDFHKRLTEEEKAILRVADCLDGMLFCIREAQLGNASISQVFHRYREYIRRMEPLPASASRILYQTISLWEAS